MMVKLLFQRIIYAFRNTPFDKETVKQFKLERERHIQAIVSQSKQDNLDSAKNNLAWVEFYSQLLSIKKSTRLAQLVWSVVIALICLFIVGLAWILPVFSAKVLLEIETKSVTLTLNEEWYADEPFLVDSFKINKLAEVVAPGVGDGNWNSEKMELSQQKTTVAKLKVCLRENSRICKTLTNAQELSQMPECVLKDLPYPRIDFSVQDDKLNMYVKCAFVTGELYAPPGAILRLGDTGEVQISGESIPDISETIEFWTKPVGEFPILLELASEKAFKLRDLNVQGKIEFLEEVPLAPGKFDSTILSGKLTMLETGVTKNLQEGDYLVLGKVSSGYLKLKEIGKKSMKVIFEGDVKQIRTRRGFFEKNLVPTWLEYIFYQNRLAFFWSAVIFLWGILWSVRNMIFH